MKMSGRPQPPEPAGVPQNGTAPVVPAVVPPDPVTDVVEIDPSLTGRSLIEAADDAHCAFLFDHEAYQRELAPVLHSALASSDPTELMAWLLANQARLKNPFNAEFIEDGWVEALEYYDVAEFGAYALSAFFEPSALRGLGSGFDTARDALVATGRMPEEAERMLAGEPIVAERIVDPSVANGNGANGNGKPMAVYCVPDGRRAGLLLPQQVKEAASALALARRSAVGRHQVEIGAQLDDLVALFEEAQSVGVGVMFVCARVDGDESAENAVPPGVGAVAADGTGE